MNTFLTMAPESAGVAELNRMLCDANLDHGHQIQPISMNAAGGALPWMLDVYAAAFRYVSPEEFEACIVRAPWSMPERVLYVMHPGEPYQDSGLRAQSVEQVREARNTRHSV
jgi:hypothetical protein